MENNPKNLLDEVFMSVDRIGVDATIRLLQATITPISTQIQTVIFRLVCSEFNVSKADLISDAQNPKFYYPRIALSYLMYTHMNLTLKEVGHITNRSNSSVHRCIQDVKALDDKFTDQKEVKRKILKLDEELKKLKSKSK